MSAALANQDCVSISDKAAIEAGDMKIFTPSLKMHVAWKSARICGGRFIINCTGPITSYSSKCSTDGCKEDNSAHKLPIHVWSLMDKSQRQSDTNKQLYFKA
jgi:hypothetical protein